MQTLRLSTRVGKDGILKIETPIGITDADLEVVLVVNQKNAESYSLSTWPDNFFTDIVGGWEGKRLAREPQGMYETRNEFKRVPDLKFEDWRTETSLH
jgi:hypothetical protein